MNNIPNLAMQFVLFKKFDMMDYNSQIHKYADPAKIRNATNMVSINRLAFGGRGVHGRFAFDSV